ncbi:extracellular calcium-sensing receptor-like [Protopterus annectens]|uniref:extracellular calcium-sensing receptor-like n=1 Tax=Protopterus annectens TaxID=7888 RepID=UPI001CFB0841|nr:extracellular calcium-sensing receptor-like [Protopterus annectens]
MKSHVIPDIFGIPKIHKNNPPMRPIVDVRQAVTMPLAKDLDYHLIEIDQNVGHLCKDSWELLAQDTIEEKSVPVLEETEADNDWCHVTEFNMYFYQYVQCMLFGIDEVNQSVHLLPNISLGFGIYDSCDTVEMALKGIIWLLTGESRISPNYHCPGIPPSAAIIGDLSSKTSVPIARILGLYKYPQISYVSSVSILSDKHQFPSFLRTIPSDNYQSRGLARLLVYFGWTWVGLLAENTDYGYMGSKIFKDELAKAEVCLAFSETIPIVDPEKKIQQITDIIAKSTAKAILIFSFVYNMYPLMEEVVKRHITGKIWIASDGWADSPLLSKPAFLKPLHGTIGFMNLRGNIPGFQNFLYNMSTFNNLDDIFLKTFWENAFGCNWLKSEMQNEKEGNLSAVSQKCTGSENLKSLNIGFFDVSNLRYTYNVYIAVYVISHALHNMSLCRGGEGPFANRSCTDLKHFKPWQLLHYIRTVHFRNNIGEEISFDENGDPPALYDILNWQMTQEGMFKYVEVGRFDSRFPAGQDLAINRSLILWNTGNQVPSSVCSDMCQLGHRKAPKQGQPVCCFHCVLCSEGEIANHTDSTDCLKCAENEWPTERQDRCQEKSLEFLTFAEPLGATLASAAIFCALLTTTVLFIFVRNRDTPIVKANNRQLSYLLLCSLILSFLCSLNFIGHPVSISCMLRQVVFGIVFTLSVSCVLAKTIMVVIAFSATKPNSNLKRWVGPALPNVLIISCTSIQLVLCIAWLLTAPAFPEQNTRSQPGRIIIECNEGSTTLFWCMLGYMGLLATVSFIVAFLSRNLPGSFNEAKVITFSMFIFVIVWLSFVPGYLSTKGKFMVAVEIFAILSSSAALVSCIFIPKCFNILLRPHINTKDYLMGKEAPNKQAK